MTDKIKLRVILIGGSSHSGKSTMAQAVAEKLRWSHLSTDSLARHPGRPWRVGQKDVPEHVAHHYCSLTVEELLRDVLQHYRRIWPEIENLITTHVIDPSFDRLILEGSALWPEFVATVDHENVASLWLTASNDLFQHRIQHNSQFDLASDSEKFLIQKFLDRTILYNMRMMAVVNHLGLKSQIVEERDSVDRLSDRCLELLIQGSGKQKR